MKEEIEESGAEEKEEVIEEEAGVEEEEIEVQEKPVVEEEVVKEEEEERRKRGPFKSLKILKQKKEDFDGERFLSIRFYPKLLSAPKWKRAKKAVKILQERIKKYVKNIEDPNTGKKIRIKKPLIWLSPDMNELIWSRGARNPPRKVRVRVLYKIINADEGEVELRVFPFAT